MGKRMTLAASASSLTAALLFFSVSGCKKTPVGPIEPKDPRTYTWTIDTLDYPGSAQTIMQSIWGSSPSDVYVVGHNDGGYGKMYHYNGKTWTPVVLYFPDRRGNAAIDLGDIYGFASNDAWAVGERILDNPHPPPNFLDSSLIIHFDGTKWVEHHVSNGRLLQTVWGSAPNDVWTGGLAGTFFHYDGLKWTKVPMDTNDSYRSLTGFGPNDVYLMDIRGLMHYDGNAWRLIDSVQSIYQIGVVGRELFALEYGIWNWDNGIWNQELVTDWPMQGIFGSSQTNIFAVGQGSLIYYYDGNTWTQLRNIVGDGWWLHKVWCTQNEVFIVGHDYGGFKTIILHGK
ncbi:MAG: hypothetical protein M1303_08800 [Bacteroidetes bacterium]|nr:hypothetical protein [Bacteroidota bacterium]